jgi:quercetin dioxygenase-like cupin family protein
MSEEWKARPERPAAGALLHFRLAEQIDRLERETTWQTSKHNAITLTKEPALRVVLVVLGAARKIHEHQASGPFTLQVVSGRLRFSAAGETLDLASGEVVALESAQPHGVEALEDSAFLLTLTRGS